MTPRKQTIAATYYKNLRSCTKTVSDLYFKQQQSFPKEYLGLISGTRNPNGIILRIPKIQAYSDIELKVLRVKNHGKDFTLDELEDLTNAWVYLENEQDPLQYLDDFFKYIIGKRQLTDYRIKQMYLDLELDEEDDYTKDPDYTPCTDSEDYYEELEYTTSDDDSDNLEISQFEFKKPGLKYDSDCDSDDSPDYVPSVESEDEYENVHRTYVAKKKPIKSIRH